MAFRFAGNGNKYLSVSLGGLAFSPGQLAVLYWWKTPATLGAQYLRTFTLFDNDAGAYSPRVTHQYHIGDPGIRTRAFIEAGGGTLAIQDAILSSFSSSTYYCIGERLNGTSAHKAYKNGSPSTGSAPATWPDAGNVNTIYIGQGVEEDQVASGDLEHFIIWSGGMDDTKFAALYNGSGNSANPTTQNSGNIVAYWDGTSLASQIGGLTLAQTGSGTDVSIVANAAAVDAYAAATGNVPSARRQHSAQ